MNHDYTKKRYMEILTEQVSFITINTGWQGSESLCQRGSLGYLLEAIILVL